MNKNLVGILSLAYAVSFAGHIFAQSNGPDAQRSVKLTATLCKEQVNRDKVVNREVVSTEGHVGGVLAVTFSPDGRRLASGGKDQKIRIWDISEFKFNGPLEICDIGWPPFILKFSPDGRGIAFVTDLGFSAALWDVTGAQPKERGLLQGHRGAVNSIVFSSDGKMLATAGSDFMTRLWDLSGDKIIEKALLSKEKDTIVALAFSPDGRTLVSSSVPRILRIWDLSGRSPKSAGVLKSQVGNNTISLRFTPDGKSLIEHRLIENDKHSVLVWDIQHQSVKSDTVIKGFPKGYVCSAISADGMTIVTGDANSRVIIWEVISGKQLFKWELAGKIMGVSFSDDGKYIAAGSDVGTVSLIRRPALKEQ